MPISHLTLTNFKSFRELDLSPGNLTVLIGANSAGKSNATQALAFVRDICLVGLKSAVSIQGGPSLLKNQSLESNLVKLDIKISEPFVRIVPLAVPMPSGRMIASLIFMGAQYSLELKIKGDKFEVVKDRLEQPALITEYEGDNRLINPNALVNKSGEFVTYLDDGTYRQDVSEELVEVIDPKFLEAMAATTSSSENVLLDARTNNLMPPVFRKMGLYDFDPKLSRRAIPITGKAELEHDGSNLAIVLKSIYEDKAKCNEFYSLMKSMLPFFGKLKVSSRDDKSLMFRFSEIYAGKKTFFPSSAMSDGTAMIALLVVALYFEGNFLSIIEEPERNVHSHLINKIASLLQDASRSQQIIVSTHNPELLKSLPLEDIVLIKRDKDGFSTAAKLSAVAELKAFLDEEIGIADLFTDGLITL